jgi:hypothetical protein
VHLWKKEIPPEPDVPVVEVVLKSLGTGGFRQ